MGATMGKSGGTILDSLPNTQVSFFYAIVKSIIFHRRCKM